MTKEKQPTYVVTPELVRFSYVHLDEPYAIGAGQEPKYSVMILIPKTSKKTLAEIKRGQEEAYKAKKQIFGKTPFEAVNTTLRDGDLEHPDLEEYQGMYFMGVSNKYKPEVVGTLRDEAGNPKPLDPTDPEEIYSGMWGRVGMSFFAYDSTMKKGISASLATVQKVRDGERLGGFHADAAADFAEFEDDSADDLLANDPAMM
ncbi:DUF2815 family protein [Xylocopilactobacillus apis]|uniref:DUF2815 domain-containing protein n=1 Tax=Xylocopilactobacillus apis TaxID=2932183 RepID=A0AAU9DPF0_9LACO|nr:DUF2815 family protein [Xylocopilactobacillus apis]BDR56903.1 hypothetical protein KIMC2_14650 [Xylocopilactobacillus apis]